MDAGEYTCVATNPAGQVSDTVTLEVGCEFIMYPCLINKTVVMYPSAIFLEL